MIKRTPASSAKTPRQAARLRTVKIHNANSFTSYANYKRAHDGKPPMSEREWKRATGR